MDGINVPHCADVRAERMAAVLAAAAGEFVFGIEGVLVVTAAEDEFQIGRGGEDVLHEDTVGVGFVSGLGMAREIACAPVLLIWAQSQSNQLPCGLPSKPCTM